MKKNHRPSSIIKAEDELIDAILEDERAELIALALENELDDSQ